MRNRLFKTRRGAIIVSAVAALAAALLLVIYLRSYRSSVNANTVPERVLVATGLISKGTAGTLIAAKREYQVTTVPKNQLEINALSDPSQMSGQVAATDIFAGQQLTSSDFTSESTSALNFQLTGPQRAIAVPTDTLHGLQGEVAAGDYVDVYVSISGTAGTTTSSAASTSALAEQVRLLAPNILVLAIPGAGIADTILRVDAAQVPKFAYVADYERFWLVLRPQVDASPTPPAVATLGSLLQGGG
jgi:Flp pilus assembly protein CpaB